MAEEHEGDPTNGESHNELSKYRQLAEAISKAAEEARVRRLSFERVGGGNASDEGLAELRRKAEEAEQSRDLLVAEGMKMTNMESPKSADPVWHWESVYKRLDALDKDKN
jgi:hypothetical protein